MSELRIIRGSDIQLYAGDTPLFGVTAFSAAEKKQYHAVYEYGNAAACAYIPQGASYELELCVLSLFDKQLPTGSFTLRVVDGDTTYSYDACRVTGRKTAVKGSGKAVEVFTLAADNMRKQVAQT